MYVQTYHDSEQNRRPLFTRPAILHSNSLVGSTLSVGGCTVSVGVISELLLVATVSVDVITELLPVATVSVGVITELLLVATVSVGVITELLLVAKEKRISQSVCDSYVCSCLIKKSPSVSLSTITTMAYCGFTMIALSAVVSSSSKVSLLSGFESSTMLRLTQLMFTGSWYTDICTIVSL